MESQEVNMGSQEPQQVVSGAQEPQDTDNAVDETGKGTQTTVSESQGADSEKGAAEAENGVKETKSEAQVVEHKPHCPHNAANLRTSGIKETENGLQRPSSVENKDPEAAPALFNDMGEPLPNVRAEGPFYAVFVPWDASGKALPVKDLVFLDKDEAMRVLKTYKKGRVTSFEEFKNACQYATGTGRFSHMHNCDFSRSSPANMGMGERPSVYKAPKPQDMVKFRKVIEQGDAELVRKLIHQNPRYLVSSGDTPSILQEGFRYNALHVAAKAKAANVAELILYVLGKPEFMHRLYGDDNLPNVDRRIGTLLDLYLNTPDKGLNETALHFASKYGALEVVEALVCFPQCDKTLRNKYDQTAAMIVCDRCESNQQTAITKKKIAALLENNYYVPVLRAEDDSVEPVVGKPFSPGKPAVDEDLLSPKMEIHAYAGPMDREGAEQFRRVWRTPPRTTTTPVKVPRSLMSPRADDRLDSSVFALKCKDSRKGLERIGKQLAAHFDICWKEYWAFLDAFVDITSAEGLQLFENHLKDVWAVPGAGNENDLVKKMAVRLDDLVLDDAAKAYPITKSLYKDGVFSAHYCLDKALDVIADRMSYDLSDTHSTHNTSEKILASVRRMQLLTMSYMEDARFQEVNFRCLHQRFAFLLYKNIQCKQCRFDTSNERRAMITEKLRRLYDYCLKCYDGLSSEDEEEVDMIKLDTTKRHMVCILGYCLKILKKCKADSPRVFPEENNADVVTKGWERTPPCHCTIQRRKNSRINKRRCKNCRSHVGPRKKLMYAEDDRNATANGSSALPHEESSSDTDTFYTPPSSPPPLFKNRWKGPKFSKPMALQEKFIEGKDPCYADYEAFKALLIANVKVDSTKYPNVYLWRHFVSLYTEEQMKSWATRSHRKQYHYDPFEPAPPPKPWMLIMGANSPQGLKKNRMTAHSDHMN